MARINKIDTDGTKGLLALGEFGYDNYPIGGDIGRVYVGNGSENIPLAKKVEVDNISPGSRIASSTNINPDSIEVSNILSTTGFSIHLYTGNGTTQDIENGIDFVTAGASVMVLPLWTAGTYNEGDEVTIVREGRTIRVVCLQDGVISDPNTLYGFTDATFSDWQIDSQTNGGLVWIQNRDSALGYNSLFDTLRNSNFIYSNTTDIEYDGSSIFTGFLDNGFNIISNSRNTNYDTDRFVSWSYQTTHIKSSLTSHGKPQIEEYNPITGFTMIKYKGSGLAGHEIAHSIGRELGISHIKNLDGPNNWISYYGEDGYILKLNDAAGKDSTDYRQYVSDQNNIILNSSNSDVNNGRYITYAWANAIETDEGLQGNFEIGTYSGTGVAGNKITTKGKPAYVMIKRLDSTGDWVIFDSQRDNSTNPLFLNLSSSELTSGYNGCSFGDSYISILDVGVNTNASGGQYLYKVIYDNDNGSGKSKYDKPTETSNLNLTDSYFNYTAGLTDKGYTLTNRAVTKTIDTSGVSDGIKWVSENSDGTNSFYDVKPSYGLYTKTSADDNRPVFVDGKWYSTSGDNIFNGGNLDSQADVDLWTTTGNITSTTYDSGMMKIEGTIDGYVTQSLSLEIGEKYILRFDRVAGTINGSYYINDGNGLKGYTYDGVEHEIELVANIENVVVWFYTNGTGYYYIDNVSISKSESTIDAEILPTPSFMKNPVMIQNGIPQYIDYTQELETSYMDSLVVEKLTTKNNRVIKEIGTIYNDNRYTIPFESIFSDYSGNHLDYEVKCEVKVSGIWGEAGWIYSTTSRGTKGFSNEEGVIVQTGNGFVIQASSSIGGASMDILSNLTSAPARIIVTYHGKAKEI